ncbi:kinase-like domain-containing protein [Fomitopsis betulina]|nr:kinase-like domain-containing protein [Fomitopsis betulina]
MELRERKRHCAELVVALMQLHQRGIMHRDIKPENIFIADSGKWLIGDFGLALIEERGALRDLTSDEKVGTEHYLAPEQVKGLTYTGAVDVWQLGCVLIELLRGSRGWPNPWKTTLTDRRGYSLNMVTASLEDIEDAVQRSLYSIIPDPDELGMLLPGKSRRATGLPKAHLARMVQEHAAGRCFNRQAAIQIYRYTQLCAGEDRLGVDVFAVVQRPYDGPECPADGVRAAYGGCRS